MPSASAPTTAPSNPAAPPPPRARSCHKGVLFLALTNIATVFALLELYRVTDAHLDLDQAARWTHRSAVEQAAVETHKARQQVKLRESEIELLRARIEQLEAYEELALIDLVELSNSMADILDTASGPQRIFLERAIPQAIRLQIKENIPASTVLAMAIYESGYGQSLLARKHHNYFGMKAFGDWTGPIAASMPTRDSGVLTRANFRSYTSLYEGFCGFAEFLKRGTRYRRAFLTSESLEFVRELLKRGYCPDRDYLDNIREIMLRHRLAKLDGIARTFNRRAFAHSPSPEIVPAHHDG